MLANLDNEVHFKKVFTDVDVFCAFVKDVLGIDMKITKVETEVVLPSRVGAIKFRMDLVAESTDHRTVVEIQKVDYDYSYDRFSHYFIGNLIDMQRDSKTYAFAKDVFIIVVMTGAYHISDKNGQPIKDDVLVTDTNPRNLKGEIRDMHNHKMVILNTTCINNETPPDILDWLNLIIQSMTNPKNPKINRKKPAIVRAAKLAERNKLTPEQLADSKIQEMRKITVAVIEDTTTKKVTKKVTEEVTQKVTEEVTKKVTEEVTQKVTNEVTQKVTNEVTQKVVEENIVNALRSGLLSMEQITAIFGVSLENVQSA